MDCFNIIIYKVVIFYIPQKNRSIKKIYYKKIGIVENIEAKKLSNTCIEVQQQIKSDYIMAIVNTKEKDNHDYDYFKRLNMRSEKLYNSLKYNKNLLTDNKNIKQEYFKVKYDNLVKDKYIIEKMLKDIDIIK